MYRRLQSGESKHTDIYLSGEKLYGDDFSEDQLRAWHKDEEEGFLNLRATANQDRRYPYHSLNSLHGFRYLGSRRYYEVLGFGSAFGDEFIPILSRVEKLTILDRYGREGQISLHNIPVRYVRPTANGVIPFQSNVFDLITCFSVLHHIPNVTFTVNEIHRCLAPSGIALIREPIVSMGDWSLPRKGLTERERGIPSRLLIGMILNAGFEIINVSYCEFSLIPKVSQLVRISAYNSGIITHLDSLICKIFKWNASYHARGLLQKLRPIGMAFVLRKDKPS